MITYKTHKNLDIVKYDKCIEESLHARIYAYSWYLNCVADNWDVLVLNDYEAVMPLPKRKKYGLNYVYQVPWSQQLGIFSKRIVDKDLILSFIKTIPKKFVLVDYNFNSGNTFSCKYVTKKINFILNLNTSYEDIRKHYNKNRKRITKQYFSDYVLDKRGSFKGFLHLYSNQEIHYKIHKDSLAKLQNLLKTKHAAIHIWNVYKNGELLAGLVWLKDKSRITYLIPVATDQAKKENIPTFVLNELIKEYENTEIYLDFEGSMVKGVAQFYKSFGAKKEEYYWYRKKFSI